MFKCIKIICSIILLKDFKKPQPFKNIFIRSNQGQSTVSADYGNTVEEIRVYA